MNPRLLRPTPTGFDPRRISGLVAWWDAQVASSYTIETGVKEWRDLSGNGHTVTQSITNNQPAIDAINGKTALLFDGSNDDLSASSSVLTGVTQASAFTFIGVTQQTAAEAGYIISNTTGSGGGTAIYANASPSPTTYALRYDGAFQLPSPTRSNDTPEVWATVHNNQSAVWAINGSAAAEVTTASTFVAPSQNMTIGNRPGGTVAATYFAGRIGSLLIYNRALSAPERSRIERWLGRRWGITVA
jgi:hypothetical protein